jgi:hypothetical protein
VAGGRRGTQAGLRGRPAAPLGQSRCRNSNLEGSLSPGDGSDLKVLLIFSTQPARVHPVQSKDTSDPRSCCRGSYEYGVNTVYLNKRIQSYRACSESLPACLTVRQLSPIIQSKTRVRKEKKKQYDD